MNIVLVIIVLIFLHRFRDRINTIPELLHRTFPILGKITALVITITDAVSKVLDNSITAVTPVLAWIWVACLGLNIVQLIPPLEFANLYVQSGTRVGLWLLVFFAARHFRWSYYWPKMLWFYSLAIVFLSYLLMYFGGPFFIYETVFFLPVPSWYTTYIYFQRGNTVLVDQRRKGGIFMDSGYLYMFSEHEAYRRVILHPITPLFHWVESLQFKSEPPASPTGKGWVVVNKEAADFNIDPEQQQRLDAAKVIERQCWVERQRIDSLAIIGQLPRQARTLPTATQRGANTVGCLVDNEVWCNYLILANPGECKQQGAVGIVSGGTAVQKHKSFTLSAIMRIGRIYRHIMIRLPELHGAGVYHLPDNAYEHGSPQEAHLTLINQKTAGDSTTSYNFSTTTQYPVTLVVTRFDTVAKVVAGTFEGKVFNSSNHLGAMPVTQGRFDVKYYTE